MRSPDRWQDERDPRERADRVVAWFTDDERKEPARADHWGRGPRRYRRADRRILEDVSDRLTDDPDVDASDIEVSVTDGEVTFEGTVGDRAQRRRAEDIAERVLGVTHVQNNLRVRSPDRVEPTGGFWGFVTGLFASDEDRQAYAEGVRRGGVLLTATVGEAMAAQATQVLRQAGAVDLQARAAEWRASGWRGQGPEAGGSGV